MEGREKGYMAGMGSLGPPGRIVQASEEQPSLRNPEKLNTMLMSCPWAQKNQAGYNVNAGCAVLLFSLQAYM